MKNVPPSGVRTPDSIFARVDLPLPFSPTMAWTSPGCIVRLHLLRAIVSPNRFEISRTTIAFSDIGMLPLGHDEPIKAVPRRWLDNERPGKCRRPYLSRFPCEGVSWPENHGISHRWRKPFFRLGLHPVRICDVAVLREIL